MMKNVVNVIIFLSIIMTFSSCGYSSSAKFSRAVIGEKISTTVVVSSQDPENSVVMKDALDSAILEVFHSSLTTKKRSKTHIELSIFDIRYTPMQYDKYGYIIAYRATTTLKIIKTKNQKKKTYMPQGSYDFAIVANAVMTDKERFEAINLGSVKAIKSFIAQVSAEGAVTRKDI